MHTIVSMKLYNKLPLSLYTNKIRAPIKRKYCKFN